MAERILPRYPIYIPSKGRYTKAMAITAGHLLRDEVPFRMVVEEPEAEVYARLVGDDHVLVLPFMDLGSVIPARNWIKDHATAEGHERHWQLDDNMRQFRRLYRGQRIPCSGGIALRVCEDFTDRFENVAISGLNYEMFGVFAKKPFVANCHVYSCSLVNNAIPHGWRQMFNEDTDLCLQVLADGWCTLLLNAFLADKVPTMTVRGGNTDALYQGDGRLKMARSLERVWPYVVETDRRFQRPQHVVRSAWRKFDTPLRLKAGVDMEAMAASDEGGISLRQLKEPQSRRLRESVARAAGEPLQPDTSTSPNTSD